MSKSSRGFIFLSASSLISKVLSLIYLPFLIRILGEEGYGIYYTSYEVFAFVYVLAITGLSIAIPKKISEFAAKGQNNDAEAVFVVCRNMMGLLGAFFSISLLLSARFLTSFMHYDKAYYAVVFLSPSIFIASLMSAYRGYLQGVEEHFYNAVSMIVEQFANIVFTLLFALLLRRNGMEFACAGGTIGTFAASLFALIYLVFCRKRVRRNIDYSWKTCIRRKIILSQIIRFSAPFLLSYGLIYIGNNILDISIVKGGLLKIGMSDSEATSSFASLAKYYQIRNVPFMLVTALTTAALPVISKASALSDRVFLQNKINGVFRIGFLISIPCASGLTILGKPIFQAIFGFGHSAGYSLMQYGAFVVVFMTISQIQTTVLNAVGEVFWCNLNLIFGIAAKIIFNFILVRVPSVNIYGAIGGSFMCFFVPSVLNGILLYRKGFLSKLILVQWIKPLASSFAMSIVSITVYLGILGILKVFNSPLYISSFTALMTACYLSVLAYAHILLRTGCLEKTEISLLPSSVRKVLFIA